MGKGSGDISVEGWSISTHGNRAKYRQKGRQPKNRDLGQHQKQKGIKPKNTSYGIKQYDKHASRSEIWLRTITKNSSKYCLGAVTSGEIIKKDFFTTLGNTINDERARRGHSERNYKLSSFISGSEINELRKGLTDAGYPGAASVSIGSEIKAVDINGLVQAIVNAGLVCTTDTNTYKCTCDCNHCTCDCNNCTCNCNYCTCDCNNCTCNCNYCTCDCNYCTCDCNYSCTCNCNYSDKRLKKDINFLEVVSGLNIYSFKYVWDNVIQKGVMAQEVLESDYSEAVSVDSNGYYMVDYSKLPITI